MPAFGPPTRAEIARDPAIPDALQRSFKAWVVSNLIERSWQAVGPASDKARLVEVLGRPDPRRFLAIVTKAAEAGHLTHGELAAAQRQLAAKVLSFPQQDVRLLDLLVGTPITPARRRRSGALDGQIFELRYAPGFPRWP